jgi:hypothetical protein
MYNINSNVWKPINFAIAGSKFNNGVPTADQIYNTFYPKLSTSSKISVNTVWSPSTSTNAAINNAYMRCCI